MNSNIYRPFLKGYRKPTMTKTQLKELKEAFDLFDTEKNGFIDAKELKRNLEILGFSCKNSSLNTFFADVESAETRNITFQQFLESGREHFFDIKKIFRQFDCDKNGKISLEDFKEVSKSYGENFTDADLSGMLLASDLNEDGELDFNDFCSMITKTNF